MPEHLACGHFGHQIAKPLAFHERSCGDCLDFLLVAIGCGSSRGIGEHLFGEGPAEEIHFPKEDFFQAEWVGEIFARGKRGSPINRHGWDTVRTSFQSDPAALLVIGRAVPAYGIKELKREPEGVNLGMAIGAGLD